jgi:tellurite resistance protein TerC
VLRGFFIAAGGALLESFHWAIYVFGGLLFLTGVRLFLKREKPFKPQPIVPSVRALRAGGARVSGASFTVVESQRRYVTPLLLALVAVETADLVFAVDSIPAIFAITPDPFIVFTSNVFAMLGLRSLYFLAAGVMVRFHYLGAGLALVLGFVGLKMLLSDVYEIPIGWSLGAISLLIGGSIFLSFIRPRGRYRTVFPPSDACRRLSKS